ncbi:MAG: hypothetical protein NVSMB19_26600 [Vulcanimicrobiaceae bacterium]
MSNAFADLPEVVTDADRASLVRVGPGVVDRLRKMLNWKFGCTATAAFELYGPDVKANATIGRLLEIARDSSHEGLELAVFRLVMLTASEATIRRRHRA